MRILLLIVCLVCAAAVKPAKAQSIKPAVDVMLALDDSGSMRKNDPKRLLKMVVRGFAQRLEPGDRLGLVMFAESARRLMELTPVSDVDFGPALDTALARLTYNGRLTDIPRGLELARYELDHNRRNQVSQIVVLLTDGQVDLGSPAGDAEAKRYLRATVIPDIRNMGARVFGMTLTDEADVSLFQEITQATGGNYFKLREATEIQAAFDRISAVIQGLRDPPVDQERAVEVIQKTAAAQLQEIEAQRQQLAEQQARVLQEAEQWRQQMIDLEAQAAKEAERRRDEDEQRSKAAIALFEKQSQILGDQRRSPAKGPVSAQWLIMACGIVLFLLLGGFGWAAVRREQLSSIRR
jgi:Mg-chelatase subunit ChlD